MNFEEYTRLYWEAWGDPTIRWLLSNVSTSMIIDDHDIRDDWNISRAGSTRSAASRGGRSASSAA